MAITPQRLIKNINDLIYEWQKSGLIFASRKHQAFRKSNGVVEVTWGNDGYILKDQPFSTIAEYCALIENKQYSMLLNDGSFFQISYSFKRGDVIKHRLCWYPAPIQVSADELEYEDISDLVLSRMSEFNIEGFKSKSPVRFDFAPEQKSEEHPEVHLHLSEENCRIPVRSPLCLRKFMFFIVDNFYDDIKGKESLYTTASSWEGKDTLTEGQKANHHLNIFETI